MDLLDALLVPKAIIGCLVGLLAAVVVHNLEWDSEPVLLEAGLVAAGFLIGLLCSKKGADHDREPPARNGPPSS